MFHGGDLLSYSHLYDGEMIDFSSNINPLGPPPKIWEAFEQGHQSLCCYPDIKYRKLRDNISKYLACDYKEVMVGNGAVEIINNICMLYERIIVVTPCFAEYIRRPEVLGKEVVKIRSNKGFEINTEIIYTSIKKGDLLLLGNPNNPTGKRIDKETLLKIHEICTEKGAFLALDEAFYEFCPQDYDSIKLFRNSKNVWIIRAATKFFALPGLRLGYGFACKELIDQYCHVELPWSVNSFAVIAGDIIFQDIEYIKSSRQLVNTQRQFMMKKFSLIDKIKAYESDTNFILIELLWHDEEEIFELMIKRGLLIRKCSSFEGLGKNFIRVAVKSHFDNSRLIEELNTVINNIK